VPPQDAESPMDRINLSGLGSFCVLGDYETVLE